MATFAFESFKAFLFSFVSCVCLVPLFRIFAVQQNFLDVPNGETKQHEQPMPCLGGVSICCAFWIGLWCSGQLSWKVGFLFAPSVLFLSLGFVDDLLSLKPRYKFLGQLFVVFLVLTCALAHRDLFFLFFLDVPCSSFLDIGCDQCLQFS